MKGKKSARDTKKGEKAPGDRPPKRSSDILSDQLAKKATERRQRKGRGYLPADERGIKKYIRARAASLDLSLLKVLPPVTEKQGKCLQFIWEYYRRNMYYPTHREVAEAMDVQSNTAEMYLQPLVQKGYLHREPRKQRNIRLTSDALEKLAMMGINIQGQVPDR